MKFLNLRRKLKNSALAVLFAVAVMFVMPATAFADDTDTTDNGIVNFEFENGIENNDNIDSTIGFGVDYDEQPSEDFTDFSEAAEPEVTDSLIPSDNCYGICCDACDENCDGTCCDMCTIVNAADDINVPDNSEYGYGFGDESTAGSDVPADIGSETDNGLEGGFGNPYGEITNDPTDGFTNSNENIIPVFPNEPIFPDDYNNVIIPENPEDVYQPEVGNEPADNDLMGDTYEDFDNENEEILFDDDLTDEEEEIIFGDDDLTDDEKTETPDDSNSENSDNASDEENSDNTDEENSDNTIDEESNDNSDSENSDNTADDTDNSDIDDSDNITDENDTINSDDAADEKDLDNSDEENSDNAADEENPDDSDSEALEEDDNPIINVVLPASISVVINPYNLKVVDESDFHYSISSPEYSIKNYSNCDVSVIATVSASTEGGIVLSPYNLSGNETEFTAFAYIEATNESNVYSDNYNNGANQIAFSNEVVSKEILMLADGSNGETVGYFRIKGQAVLPDGAQYSDQAMLNMVITFDIDPVSKPVVSDDAVEEEPENVENTENSENVENTESSENVENAENSGNIENTESSENVENTENSENFENNESSENVENTENSENIENTESSENVENTVNIENTESVENVQ